MLFFRLIYWLILMGVSVWCAAVVWSNGRYCCAIKTEYESTTNAMLRNYVKHVLCVVLWNRRRTQCFTENKFFKTTLKLNIHFLTDHFYWINLPIFVTERISVQNYACSPAHIAEKVPQKLGNGSGVVIKLTWAVSRSSNLMKLV